MKKLLIPVLALTLLCGCSKSEESETCNLAILVQNTSNMNTISLNSDSIYNALYNTSYTAGNVGFINVDGNPEVTYQTTIPEIESNLSDHKKDEFASNYTSQLQEALASIEANDEEVDVLDSLRLAGKMLSDKDGDKLILVLSSGVSTTGYLNFCQSGLLDMDPDDIVNELKIQDAIPDVSNCRIQWAYCGECAYPQDELSESQKVKLEKIYEAILLAGGASEVTFTSDIPSDNPNTNLPNVSVISSDSKNIEVMDTITLDETSLQFVGNSSEFVDEQSAISSISYVASQLNAYPDHSVYIVGTTATGDEDFCQSLSQSRANAVKDILVNTYGIDENRLNVVGLGFWDPWHVNDLDEDGNHIEELASQNRCVRIIDVNSSDVTF